MTRRRQVGGIAARCSGIHPRDDRRDLVVAQRRVVLELLNADVPNGVPWRHLARRDLRLDRSGPRPRVLVREERHRRAGSRPMATLTRTLENRRHVPGERGRGGDARGRRRRRRPEDRIDADLRRRPVRRLVQTAAAGVLDLDHRIDLPIGRERTVGLFRVSVRRQGPHHLTRSPVARHPDAEGEPVETRIEVRGLSGVGSFRDHAVLGTNQDDHLFDVIPIEVSEYQVERAVDISLPAVEDRDDRPT